MRVLLDKQHAARRQYLLIRFPHETMRIAHAAPASYANTIKLCIFAAMAFGLAALIGKPAIDTGADIPAKDALVEARGQAHALCGQKGGLHFRLRGRAETFNYPYFADDRGKVAAVLEAREREVTVLFEPEAYKPLNGTAPFHKVWELRVGGRPIRSFAQSEELWRANNADLRGVFVMMVAIGIALSVGAWWALPRHCGAGVGAKG